MLRAFVRAKNKEAKEDPVADGGKKKPEPIKEGPFGLKSSKQGQEEGPVDDHQVKHPTKEAAGKVLGDEHASRLDRALNTVEHKFVSTSDCALKDMVGTYEFKDQEKGVFRYLVSVMRRLAIANFALAAASIAVTASKVGSIVITFLVTACETSLACFSCLHCKPVTTLSVCASLCQHVACQDGTCL